MEEMWPWVALTAGVAGFFLGMYFGKPRMLAGWGGPTLCNAACTCGGVTCALPVGPPSTHTHCPNQAREPTSCPGKCTNTAGPGHAGLHLCSHGHNF